MRDRPAMTLTRREWLTITAALGLVPEVSAAARQQPGTGGVSAAAIGPADGALVHVGRDPVRIKVSRIPQGRFAMITQDVSAGTSIPVHLHEREDEIIFIQSCRGQATLGNERVSPEPGSTLYARRVRGTAAGTPGPRSCDWIALYSHPASKGISGRSADARPMLRRERSHPTNGSTSTRGTGSDTAEDAAPVEPDRSFVTECFPRHVPALTIVRFRRQMMADAKTRGRFVWYDLMTSDPQGAQAFYTKIAGWGTQEWDQMPYTMWTVDGNSIGGVMQLPEAAAPPHWLGYIAVPDADAAVSQAESLGGKRMVGPEDIPNVGRFAVLTDPQGAYFAVFTPAGETPGHDGEPKIGEISWHELMTTDSAAAWTFYEKMFGWTKTGEHDMGPMGIYRLFSRAGREIGGMFNKPADMPAPPNWLHYIHADSSARIANLVKANGGQVLNGPMEVPGGDYIVQCLDPQGAAFAIHSKKP